MSVLQHLRQPSAVYRHSAIFRLTEIVVEQVDANEPVLCPATGSENDSAGIEALAEDDYLTWIGKLAELLDRDQIEDVPGLLHKGYHPQVPDTGTSAGEKFA
ncbi:hypothetical protein [Novosphingobium sp. P6W]|uniref:hypothetical protein n=1 Tax=Novosphingobium sp. P6W TaxID=1609758 RepID=UPI0005C2FC2E|nr:hypothetical protein [Novosphingobium sp. P6W]AXB80674.1 hypothetical protein TQ38_029370 [Novosphingobium sp. P6W]KIS29499.1 hypothetical protein TQ38_27535 [Novosphingobium sp. P6W]